MTAGRTGSPSTDTNTHGGPGRWRQAGVYLLFVLVPVGVSVAIIRTSSTGAGARDAESARQTSIPPIDKVLLAIVVIVAVSHVLGSLADRFGQPRVIGEIATGLLLGPSVLGTFAPAISRALWPAGLISFLGLLAQLGLVFFMFLVGRELPISLLRGNGGRAVLAGHAAIALPFLAGVVLSKTLFATYRPSSVSPLAFQLFCGIALSVTAFPVLARILVDRKLDQTRIGAIGMVTAGVSDVTAWCVLAVVVAFAKSQSAGQALYVVLATAGFAAAMWAILRPLLAWLGERIERSGASRIWLIIVILLTLLSSAAATQAMGVHTIFGAFLAGLVVPRSPATAEFATKLEGPTAWFLMPTFFAVTGLQITLGALASWANWLVIGLLVVLAVGTKLFGASLPAWLTGLGTRDALGLGVMMSCRGLTEIAVLQIGVSLGLISLTLFVMFLVMALITTALTGPLLTRLYPSPESLKAAEHGR
jgi:Kef-type K+ transport system membrane component KefB